MLGHAPYERPELVFASDTTGTLSFCLRDSALSFKKDCLAPSAPAKAGFSRVPSVFSPARTGRLRVLFLRRTARSEVENCRQRTCRTAQHRGFLS